MYSYVNEELHQVIKKNFNNNEEQLDVSIFGHRLDYSSRFIPREQ